jgi:CRISPR-associated protein Cas5h
MLDIVSFDASGEFAAFRDPSVTSNQTVYYIPSKTAVVGMVGAMLGIERGHELGDLYGAGFQDLFRRIRVGVELRNMPEKASFFTNHRSLKEPKTKPFKTEVLVGPRYAIYVDAGKETNDRLHSMLVSGNFQYSPYLGHAYCPARIDNPNRTTGVEADHRKFTTSTVILDEAETYDPSFQMNVTKEENSRIIIERHLHHFFENGSLQRKVLRHWIPVGATYNVRMSKPRLSTPVKLEDERVVCLY